MTHLDTATRLRAAVGSLIDELRDTAGLSATERKEVAVKLDRTVSVLTARLPADLAEELTELFSPLTTTPTPLTLRLAAAQLHGWLGALAPERPTPVLFAFAPPPAEEPPIDPDGAPAAAPVPAVATVNAAGYL